MGRATFRRGLTVAAACVGACVLTTAAYAGYASGPWSDMGTINTRNYENRAFVSTAGPDNPQSASGGAELQTKQGAQAPAGHLGAQGSLWKSGVLCNQTAWWYTNSASAWWGSSTSGGDCGSGNYYGDGQVRVYKPSSGNYVTAYPVNSPYAWQP